MKVAAFLLIQILAVGAFAQTSEFSRGSGGDINLITKHDQPFSGSIAISSGMGLGATLGGTLVKDRVWFFATGERSDSMFAPRQKMTASLGDRQSLAASTHLAGAIPSSFLSLHYTGIVSSNMFVTASFSELRRTNPGN